MEQRGGREQVKVKGVDVVAETSGSAFTSFDDDVTCSFESFVFCVRSCNLSSSLELSESERARLFRYDMTTRKTRLRLS